MINKSVKVAGATAALAIVLIMTAALVPGLSDRIAQGVALVASSPGQGGFSLTDPAGKTVTDRDYRGRFMLVFFGYTFCPDVCPTTLTVLAGALDRLAPATAAKLVPIFITLDPERDSPAVMGQYTAAFSPAIVGLTGSADDLARVKQSYRVYSARVPGSAPDLYTIDHSALLYLIGPDGRFRATLDPGHSAAELAAALTRAVE
ncbi:SCO family protein [Magnetospirillum fulvum]|uniref:Protein SCO1/2 n=1 Tax=Magnetospirillum fulvum TaxID=1082 RepID=A0A1H6GPD1_MAGFU|nr:SCO family protein [Magnetospirillum fulvum]SEH25299.1 protein SCO1/2 [Magnetospirillum fulvum]